MIQVLSIPGWLPATTNQLLTRHWSNAGKLKRKDREIVATAAFVHGARKAEGKRRVRVLIVLPKGQRACDPDAPAKSLLDSLVACGLLRNDSHAWVELCPVEFARGERLVTFVTLEDLP